MEELFSNILYLIPIAFFIAIRIINAGGKKSGDQQKKDAGGLGELIKKIQEAQENPAYGKALTEDRGIFIPSRETAPSRQPEQKKKAPKKVQPPSLSEQSAFQSALSDTAFSASGSARNAPLAQDSPLRGIKPGWTPLQQAVVWSEILGAPKGA